MTSNFIDAERRRSKRYEIKLGSILAFEEPISFAMDEPLSLQCNILDFCAHGLFLEVKKSFTDLSLLLHKKVKVLLPGEQDKGVVRIEAEVMRFNANGVGVAFEEVPESVFDDWIKKSKIQFPERFKTSLKIALEDNLPVVIDVFFKQVRSDLEQAAAKAVHFSEEAVFLDAIRDLRFCQPAIARKFSGCVLNEIDLIRNMNLDSQTRDAEHKLALVEKDDFEDWLSLSTSIKRIATDFSDQLRQLEMKLSYITGISRKDMDNPVSPAKLFHGFNKSISEIEEIGTIKPTLYKSFERALISTLPDLYQSVEKLLGEYGAPDRIGGKLVRPSNESLKSIHGTSSSEKPLREFLPESHQQTPVAYDPAASNPVQTNRSRPVQPVAQTARKLLDIINKKDSIDRQINYGNLQTFENGGSGELDPSVYSSDEIIEAIAQLQALSPGHGNIDHDSVNLHKQLSDMLAASAGILKQLSDTDKNKMEIYGQLFDILINDLTGITHIKPYLEVIRLPLMALALKDSDFLDSETHPARNVLNQLYSLEEAVKGDKVINNNKIRHTLDQLFNRIAQEAIVHSEIFAIADEELKQITQLVTKSRELNIRRVIEAYEGKQKLEKARRFIQTEIDHRIAGKMIPKVISTLLDAGWQHLLVITELNEEGNSLKRERCLKIIDELLDWLEIRGAFSSAQIIKIQQELAWIDHQLGSVCANAFLHDKVMHELRASLLGAGLPAARKPMERTFIEPKQCDSTHAIGSAQHNRTSQATRLHIGDWFILSLEDDSEPLKLAWVGDESGTHVFVNREGQKKLELGREDLAGLMRAGSVNKIQSLDEPLMERAVNRMLQKMHERLVYNASHDPVTHLTNRREFLRQLKSELSVINESRHMLCYMELLDYRMITNICGLNAGDELLKNIALLIKGRLKQKEFIARLGDKIFGILIKQCTDDEGYEIAKKIRAGINNYHFEWKNKSYSIGVSMGLVSVNQGHTVNELLQQADSASITAKRSGHNRIRLYKDDDAGIKAQAGLHEWVGRIDQVFAENRLFVRCQKITPLIESEKTRHSHYEILLGLKDEAGNILAPGDFLPAVEHCRRMPEIDRWVTHTVFNWIEQNRILFDEIGGFAINLSGQSLNSEEFLEQLVRRMRTCRVPLDKITFEVTETVASNNLTFTGTFISQIKQFGCKFSLDDFGTGYSSYSYLKSLDVDYLKIDGSFIKEIAGNPTDVAMVKSMNEIAHSLGLETIAEYVESNEIFTILKEIGVDYGQGWAIHKPVPLAENWSTRE